MLELAAGELEVGLALGLGEGREAFDFREVPGARAPLFFSHDYFEEGGEVVASGVGGGGRLHGIGLGVGIGGVEGGGHTKSVCLWSAYLRAEYL